MKRFIALVLSLVMALSLCVPAWGETVNVADADALAEALAAGKDVVLASDIKIDPANLSNAYGTTGINVKNGETIDGGNHTLDTRGANGTWDSCINTTGGIIKNITVTGAFRGIFINHNSSHSEKVILENVTTTGTTYTISCDQGTNQGLEATNCAFYGWTSYAGTLGSAVFTNCTFGEGSGYAYCRPYAPTTFVGCTFEEGFRVDPRAEVFFDNCKLGDAALTADNLATLVPSNIANAKVLGSAAAPEVKEEVEAAEPKVEVSESVTDTASAAIVAGGVEIDETELESVATDIAANIKVSETEVVKALQSEGVSTAAGATVVVQPYFDVVVEDVDVATGTITLDITPMYQLVAATDTANVDVGTNAAVIGDPQKMTIPEGKEVEITVQIPDTLAAQANGKLYVTHDGAEVYVATVTEVGGEYFAKFTTTSGFSPYVFSLSPTTVAVVGTQEYASLQAAVDAADDGDTVKLVKNSKANIKVGKNITIDPNGYKYTGKVTAKTGYQLFKNSSGNYVVTAVATKGDKFDLYLADAGMNAALKDETPDIAGLSFNVKDAKVNQDGSGNVDYIVADSGDYYVKTTTPYTTSYAVTYNGEDDILYYVDLVAGATADTFKYNEEVSAFTNFSTYDKCGYLTGTPAATDVYFQDSDGIVYKATAATAPVATVATYNYLLDGKVVTADTSFTSVVGKKTIVGAYPVDHNFVASNYTYNTTLKANVPTAALCTKCLMTSTTIYLDGKVPAATKFYELYEGTTPTKYSVVAEAASVGGSAVVTPSTDKVTSADTFDAGIAMYVGMSVMAAAGSVVVLKKRED